MTDARYTVYIDKAYRNYCNTYPDAEKTFQYEGSNIETRRMTKDEFIDMVKTDPEFSERWGLQIEERELSLEERLLLADKINKEIRQDLYSYAFNNPIYTGGINQRPDDVERHHLLNDLNIPTKLITVIYTEKIESYV